MEFAGASSQERLEHKRQGFLQVMQSAVKEGFTPVVQNSGSAAATAANLWHCPFCEIDVDMYNLEAHLDSGKHSRYRDHKQYLQMVWQQQQLGELPEYIEIGADGEYCKLCGKYATEEHILSAHHQRKLAYHNMAALDIGAICNISSSSSCCNGSSSSNFLSCTSNITQAALPAPAVQSAAVAPMPPSQPVLPSSWGNRDFYEWKPEAGCYWCKLCNKNADESHLISMQHHQRSCNASVVGIAADDSVDMAKLRAPPLPPPPPKPTGGPPPPLGEPPTPTVGPPPPPPGRPKPNVQVNARASQQWQPSDPPWLTATGEVRALQAPPQPLSVEASADPWSAALLRQDTLQCALAEGELAAYLPQQSAKDPAKWQRFVDDARELHYYHCSESGVSTWELPPGESYVMEF